MGTTKIYGVLVSILSLAAVAAAPATAASDAGGTRTDAAAGSAAKTLPGPRSPKAQKRNANYAPWNPADMDQLRKQMELVGPGPQSQIPEARFPGYLKAPATVEELMPQARAAIRQTGGRVPLGLAEPGDVVVIVVPYHAEQKIQDAVVAAFKERNIEARILWENDLVGVSKKELAAVDEATNVFKAGDGQQESGPRFENHGAWEGKDFEIYKKWVLEQDPVFFGATWPDVEYPSEELKKLDKNFRRTLANALIKYLDAHPEVKRVYYRTGGRTKSKGALKHHGGKFMGNYTYINRYDLMSQVPNFPPDVWRMVETKTLEPIAFVDRVEATDPEGTAFWFELTQQQAKAWFDGAYQQGHLYMMPNQASGRLPYSIVDYPAMTGKWVEPTQIKANGVVASTNSHATNHNRIEIHVKDGYVQEIKGGGLYGDGFRLAMQYPKINELTWPFQKEPGFWWLFEAGTGTNPKYFKHPSEVLMGMNTSERNAGGVIHWSFGTEVKMGPGATNENADWDPKTREFADKHDMPKGHAMHNHNLLPTYQVRLRDSGRWVTLIEHGVIQSYNDPEVRALAARYGKPDELLRRDWIPEIPGITVKGDYDKDYGSKAGAFWTNWSNSINEGSNKYIK